MGEKDKTKPLISKSFGAGIKLAVWKQGKEENKFLAAQLTRSYKKGDKWVDQKLSGLTMKGLDALENAISFAKRRMLEMEEKK